MFHLMHTLEKDFLGLKPIGLIHSNFLILIYKIKNCSAYTLFPLSFLFVVGVF